MHFSIDRTVHTTAFDKPVVDHWLERKIAQTAAGSTEKDRDNISTTGCQIEYVYHKQRGVAQSNFPTRDHQNILNSILI